MKVWNWKWFTPMAKAQSAWFLSEPAAIALIDNREMTTTNILKYIQGPDFPTGGPILNDKIELRQIYDAGTGAIAQRIDYDSFGASVQRLL